MVKPLSHNETVRIITEGSWNAGAAGAKMTDIPILNIDYSDSNEETRSGSKMGVRKPGDLRQTNTGGTLTITQEFHQSTITDTLLEALACSAGFSSPTTVVSSSAVTSVAIGNKFTHASAWTANPTAGMIQNVDGFVAATENGIFQAVATIDNTNIPVLFKTLAGEVAGSGVTITQLAQVVDGTTIANFAVERDLSNSILESYTGCNMISATFTFDAKSYITVAWNFVVGTRATAAATTGDGAPTAAATTYRMIAGTDIANVVEAGASICANDTFSFTVENGTFARDNCIKTLGPYAQTGISIPMCNGSYKQVLESKTIYDKAISFSDSSLAIVCTDPDDNVYAFVVDQLKYVTGTKIESTDLESGDVMTNMVWQSENDDTYDTVFRIAKA